MSGISRLGANLTLVAGSIILCFLALEVALTFVTPPPVVWLKPQESYVHDSELMHRLAPHQASYTHSYPVRTNSHGLRDEEFPIVPEARTLRILCLGDSLTFGDGVPVEATWPKQLERRLNLPGRQTTVQVINAGVSAYDTWQEIIYLQRHGVNFRPAVVLLGFYANDVVPKPTVVPRSVSDAGTLQRQGWKGFVPDHVAHVLKRSRALLFLRDRLGKLRNLARPDGSYSHKEAMLLGLRNQFVEDGWRQVEESLKQLLALGAGSGFRSVIVVFPMEDQVAGEYGSEGYQDRLRSIAEKFGIPLVDLLPSFRAAFRGSDSLFIPWDGHPNARAYEIAAKEVQDVLYSKGLIPNR